MPNFKANERTFQGVLLSTFNKVIDDNPSIKFDSAFQELNVGVGENRFSDTILNSAVDSSKKVFIELKNSSWDATDEILVTDAMTKASKNGIEYCVTGTPRQLVLFKTFKPNTTILERKIKLYFLPNVRNDNDVTSQNYISQLQPIVKDFLTDLSNLVHDIREIHWDSIDKQFINKLSAYILEASAQMSEEMIPRIKKDNGLKRKIREYLRLQEIFHVTINFFDEDVYNLSQLANYLLYLKIIFYSYLQRDVPELNLKTLTIPEDKELLNKLLRERFNDVLVHDYESIFKQSVLDEFTYPKKYLPELKSNVEQIKNLEFHDLSLDIIGSIYNTLIDNQEQHDRGQHFTSTNEVDIVNAFCINKNTKTVLDSGCGAGTFLVRGYALMKHFDKSISHIQLLERIWGIDIAPFPVLLASMNLSLLDIKELHNYPAIITKDFSDVKQNSFQNLIFQNKSNLFDVKETKEKYNKVKIPEFDACIGNPPYIRQELIEDKVTWIDLAKKEHKLKKINQQSDLYVYYLMHTASFLKENGKLGYVISSSWLDVSFGTGLQEFLLDNFKIIAIIDNQKMRSFETASINTVILIIEKCSNDNLRENNTVKFVRIYTDYKELIGQSDDENRFENINKFISIIENTKKTTKNEDYLIIAKPQKELKEESTIEGKYYNGNWGAKYLRSPEIYNKIIEAAGDKLIPLSKIANVIRGFTTGANEFFYVIDDTEKVNKLSDDEFKLHFGFEKKNSKINWEKFGWYFSELTKNHHLLERRFFKPLFKTQKEANNLDVDICKLKYNVLVCNYTLAELKKNKIKIAEYVNIAEKQFDLHQRPTNIQRTSTVKDHERDWFNLGEDLVIGDFIFPSKIGERLRVIDNRKTNVFCDKVNYNIILKAEYKKLEDILFLILNSTLFRYFLDLFSRQMVVKLSDVDVVVVEKTLVIDPNLLQSKEKELIELFKSFKGRTQETIYEEVKKEDRRKLDSIIFSILGLNENDLNELYKQATEYVKNRQLHSESLSTSKTKQKPDYQTSVKLIQERFPEIHSYISLIENVTLEDFSIPNLPAKFPQTAKTGDSNFFNTYNVIFTQGNKKITVSLSSNGQLKLFKFFYDNLEIKGQKIMLPSNSEECEKIYTILSSDFKNYSSQIKSVLKSLRSSASHLAVYRDLVMS